MKLLVEVILDDDACLVWDDPFTEIKLHLFELSPVLQVHEEAFRAGRVLDKGMRN